MLIDGAPIQSRQGQLPAPPARKSLRSRLILLALASFGVAAWLRPPAHAAGENLVLYFPSSRQLLPFASSGGAKYVPVIQALNLVGKVDGIQDKKNSLRINFNSTQIEMRSGEK